MTMTTEEFVEKVRFIHGNMYDYSNVQYVNLKTPVRIICQEHGFFEITPHAHLKGAKCPKCEYIEHIAKSRLQCCLKDIKYPLPKSFVSIDFEHLYPQHVSACSVGMTKFVNGQLVDSYYSLIRPPKDYEEKKGNILSAIHGFTSEEQFINERTMVDILPEIEEFAEGLPLVAHHASTEKYCIKNTAEYYGLQTTLDYDHIYDTEKLSIIVEIMEGRIISGENSHTLPTVSFRFNIEEKQHHNALDDAEVCGKLMLQFVNRLSHLTPIKLPLHEEKFDNNKYKEEDLQPRADLDNIPDNHFKGKYVCLTGFATPLKSQTYGHYLWTFGAKLQNANGSKTQMLICGEKAGPLKVAKAQKYGSEILSENDFLQILNTL